MASFRNEEPKPNTLRIHDRQRWIATSRAERSLETGEETGKSLARADRSTARVSGARNSNGLENTSHRLRETKWVQIHPNIQRLDKRAYAWNKHETWFQTRNRLDNIREKPGIDPDLRCLEDPLPCIMVFVQV